MDLSIIIVNFNTKELLKNCLESVKKSLAGSNLLVEVMVIDNGSTDGSREVVKNDFPEYKLIANHTNLGFAKANNMGIKEAQGEYILLLNSDTIIFPDTLPKIYKFIESKENIGVATCKVELANGQLDPACHRGFPTPWASFCYFAKLEKLFPQIKLFSGYHQSYKDFSRPHEIDSPSGAFYLVKRKVVEEVGLLDEDYFMYGEDLDWSYRIKQKGWKIYYYPYTKIIHFKKQSGRENKNPNVKKQISFYFYEAMEIFYRKHFCEKYPKLINWTILLIIKLKKNQFKV